MEDREINCLVAEHIMGLRVFREPPFDNNPVIVDDELNIVGLPEPYCTDIKAAWMVVERMTNHSRDDWCTFEMRRSTDWHDPTWGYDVRFGRQYDPTRQPDRIAWAPTAPLSVCLAALRAVGVEVR